MSVKKSDLLIGGQMRPPTSGRYYPLYSPIDGTLVAEVADASRADVDRAFDSDDEALALANDTDYGLLVSLWTLDPERQRYFVRRLEVGVVAINSTSMLSHRTPWGGFKQSGLGRRYGELGLEPFFEYKTVWT